MAHLPGRKRGRTLSRLATAVIAAALVGTTAATANADTPAPPAPQKAAEVSSQLRTAPAPAPTTQARADAPVFPLLAVNGSTANVYAYWPDGKGAYGDRVPVGGDWRGITAQTQVDHNQDGTPDGWYIRAIDGSLAFVHGEGDDTKADEIGGGWNIYNRILSPGNLGGIGTSDILAVDKDGVMWEYLAYADGKLTNRYRVGGGWGSFTDIVGRGDLNGDGKTDILAKDKSGVLWLYKGTGDYQRPIDSSRVQIGGGWNAYDVLATSGDVDLDGHTDLIARDRDGALWMYRGTGNESAPLALPRLKIGNGGWGQYTSLF